VKPPDWRRSVKRAALFLPLFFIVFSLVSKNTPIEARLLSSLAYSALFVPLTYLMDRTAYRTYLRRSGRPAKPKT
jgi:accessory gene regulator protein AgrB